MSVAEEQQQILFTCKCKHTERKRRDRQRKGTTPLTWGREEERGDPHGLGIPLRFNLLQETVICVFLTQDKSTGPQVLVSQVSHNKIPQTGWLECQKVCHSQFWSVVCPHGLCPRLGASCLLLAVPSRSPASPCVHPRGSANPREETSHIGQTRAPSL